MPAPIQNALFFLINSLFDLYLFVLIIRLVLVWVGANYFDPITQFIVKLTDPIIKPLKNRIPTLQRIELASLSFIFILELLKFSILIFLEAGNINLTAILMLAVGDIFKLLLQTFLYAIIMQVVLSWAQPASNANYLLTQFTAPLMRPLRRILPTMGGFDITPIPAILLLQLIQILFADPIISKGYSMVFN